MSTEMQEMISIKTSESQVQIDLKKILELQQLFHHRYLTPELLSQLISLYVHIVQVFSQEFIFMKSYFLEKMGFILGQPQIIKLLDGDRSSLSMLQEQEKSPSHDLQLKRRKTSSSNPNNLTEEKKNIKINMQIKLMRQVEQNMKNLSKEVANVDFRQKKNFLQISNIQKAQNQKLNKRLEKRKKKMRKNSQQLQNIEEQSENPVKKEDLVKVQKELTEAVERFTNRLTQRESLANEEQLKGRIKINQIKEQSQQQVQQIQVQEVQMEENDEQVKKQYRNSQYW